MIKKDLPITRKDDIIRWLNRGFKIDEEVNALMQAKQRAFDQACSITTRPKDIIVQSSTRNSRENLLAKIADYSAEIDARIDKLYDTKREILSVIGQVEDAQQRAVLVGRYVNFEGWEQIARALHYSKRRVFDIHSDAIETIRAELH